MIQHFLGLATLDSLNFWEILKYGLCPDYMSYSPQFGESKATTANNPIRLYSQDNHLTTNVVSRLATM